MHMFYRELQPGADQRLASIWNWNESAWASLHQCLTPARSQLLFIFPSGLSCCHQLQHPKEVKPAMLQSLPNPRHMAPGFMMCDMFQLRNSAENWERIEKRCEVPFDAISSLRSPFKERWVGTGWFYIQMDKNLVIFELVFVFPIWIPRRCECKKEVEMKIGLGIG